MFLEHLTQEASKISDREKRKTITYRDVCKRKRTLPAIYIAYNVCVAVTVANDPRLAFLTELIPKPMALAEALQHQAQRKAELGEDVQAAGLDDTEIGDGDCESAGRASPPAQGNMAEADQWENQTDIAETDESILPNVGEFDCANL